MVKFPMLNFIYQRLVLILGTCGNVLRSLARIEIRLARIEEQQKELAVQLQTVVDSVVPGPAEILNLTAGPVEEQ